MALPQQPYFIDPYTQTELNKQNEVAGAFAKQRLRDLQAGQQRGKALFGQGAFGRIGEKENQGFLDLMRRRMEGYTAPEFGAQRDIINRNLQRQYAGQAGQLAKYQGYSGVGGATAAAQMQKLMRDKNRSAQEQYQDFLVKNIEAKKAGAQDFSSALAGLQGVQAGNLDRQKAELMARFQTEMGYAGLGAADRGAASQFISSINQQKMADRPPEKQSKF